jgi:flagellar FliL protein
VEKEDKNLEKEPKGSKKSPIKWIIFPIIFLLLAGGAYFGWTIFLKNPGEKSKDNDKISEQKCTAEEDAGFGQYFSMNDFIVNLNDLSGKRYLKTKIELEFVQEEMKEELHARLAQLRDMTLLLLSSKTIDEIQNIEGKMELKNELIMRINQVLKKGKIRNLYFTEFVIQ